MKILILNWRDIKHPLSGGADISLFEHAKYWAKKGSDIVWVSSSFSGAAAVETIDGIKIIRKGSYYTVHLWAAFSFLAKKLGNPDIIVDSFHFLPYFTPLYAPKKKIIALINEVAGKVWFENMPYLFAVIGYYTEPIFFIFYKSLPFITGSDSAKDDLIRVGILDKKITVVHHGMKKVSVDSKIKKEIKPTMIFLARVSVDKGIKDALSAFVQIKKEVPNAQFWIVGKEERPGLMDFLLDKPEFGRLKKDIRYWGFVPENEKFILLKKAWVLIHPSKKEGWGLNVIEAASQGTPTVGYDVEGLRDSVKNGETGLLVDPQNISALTKAIVKLIVVQNKSLYNALSKNAVQWSKNFNWDKSVTKSWDIISKIYEENQRLQR